MLPEFLSPVTGLLTSVFMRLEKRFAFVVVNYRWIFVILFLLPLTFVYDIYWNLRVMYENATRHSAPEKHKERVEQVCQSVKKWKESGSDKHMCTARPGWLTTSLRVGKYKDTHHKISIDMKEILLVDTEKGIVRAEPLVSMGQLTKVLIPLGWTLAVTPELDDLTVGGLINGFGVETSSYKYGLFQNICTAFEIVLPDGSCVTATETENPELFRSIPWSHGTLGFLVSADIKIVPAKPWVHMRYIPYHDLTSFSQDLEKHSRNIKDDSVDFVEALQYNLQQSVIMLGKMVDEKDIKNKNQINAIGTYYKPWFYTHVESFLQEAYRGQVIEEYIPLRDYYHRHSRSIFWEMQDIIPFGNHPLFRYTLGWLVPPKISLLKLTTTPELKKLYTINHVVQDMLVPIKTLEKSVELFHEEFNVYPLWHCPMRIITSKTQKNDSIGEGLVAPLPDGDDMFIDIGAYGNPKPLTKKWDVVTSLRRVEEYVREVKGFQALYADTYMSRDEFHQMFDHTLYNKVRKTVGADKAFPQIYDKVCLKARN